MDTFHVKVSQMRLSNICNKDINKGKNLRIKMEFLHRNLHWKYNNSQSVFKTIFCKNIS